MKLTETENEIVINEAPGCMWIFGLFFALIGGTFVYGSLGGFTNYREVPGWQLVLGFFMGSVGVVTGLWIIFHAPVTKVTVDRFRRIVIHKKVGLFGKKETEYGFDEVKEFSLIEETDSDGDPIWSLGLDVANGETIKISALPSHDEKWKRDFVFKCNEFMYKQMPSYREAFETSDENEVR